MRKAEAEFATFRGRLTDAISTAISNGTDGILNDFITAVSTARGVIARPLGVVQDLIEHDGKKYISYQKQIRSGARTAQDNSPDEQRTQFESALFPNYEAEIIFGCLTLSERGVSSYGEYNLFLKDEMIDKRASVFEENPMIFVERHNILLNKSIPAGYRASWRRRGDLAGAKLHSRLTASTNPRDYPDILLNDTGGSDADFIEVHVYGEFNRRAIDYVTGPIPKNDYDQGVWKSIAKKLAEFGAIIREYR
ncbi:hypothetical protein [Rhizobium rhizogenes]|uniref:hypothetical protein n=1 Tax=Rhizobium rhizogenes TaxID=359 RepID=UPI0015722840|nr:hypothetical protein [Rhizobium rhizogenes]NTF80870.1 hypothetical protein [Rhizobium rhizogenes]